MLVKENIYLVGISVYRRPLFAMMVLRDRSVVPRTYNTYQVSYVHPKNEQETQQVLGWGDFDFDGRRFLEEFWNRLENKSVLFCLR